MTSNRTVLLRQRIGTRGTIGLVGAAAAVTLTTGIALAYTGTLPLGNVHGDSGGSSQGSLGSIGAPGGPANPAPTTDPTPTTGPTSTAELPPPAANEFPVTPRIAEVVAVEQQCHISVYYGPLAVDEGRSYVITVGSDRSVLGPTEIGDMGDGTSAYRLTDPVDYRERSLDRSYFAMEIDVGEDGSQKALDDPIYHYLGHVPTPGDGECSAEGREIPVNDSGG